MSDINNAQIEQDDELVFFCKSCHSLLILQNEEMATPWWDGSFCGKCGCADIGQCTIEEWLEEEERKKKNVQDY